MKQPIAIIGMSVKVADVDTPEGLWKLIEQHEHAFRPLSAIRQKDMFDRFGEFDIAVKGYLDRIDLFDNEFFRIAPAEAERMDPEQRLMLEGAVKMLLNAGYSLSSLRGQSVGIFHTFGQSLYKTFFDDLSNLSLTAHMPGMVGTRVANFMDWRGPVIGFDTTCSSSLSALYYACESVSSGDCSMALVGGVELGVTSRERARNSPVISRKDQCLPFDKDADGTLSGEGAICILIKRLDEAVRDGDPIHAIIRGAGINHGGALIQNISAPSPVAQSAVIRLAWENSGTDPARVRFIEAHGTGTVLGDPIEFSGLTSAFEGVPKHNGPLCSISSIKGQLGHLGVVAGMAGLVRLVLALQHQRLLPQIGFSEINPHINETDAPVSIQRTMEHWESEVPRTGGVSSYGLTGTNVHVVLEEYVAPVPEYHPATIFALKVAGTSASRAKNISHYLADYLDRYPDVPLHQLCYTVNKIMDSDPYGAMILFRDSASLQQQLRALTFDTPRTAASRQVSLLIPAVLKRTQLADFLASSDKCRLAFESLLQQYGPVTAAQEAFLLHYCAATQLIQSGIHPVRIIGAQSGRLLSLLLSGKMSMEAALQQFTATSGDTFNAAGFLKFLQELPSSEQHLLLVMGTEGSMASTLKDWQPPANVKVVAPSAEQDTGLELAAACYHLGYPLSGLPLTRATFLQNLHLPVLEPRRCWPEVKPAFTTTVTVPPPVEDDVQQSFSESAIIAGIQEIWREKLKIEEVGPEDDFFDLGGSSLLGLDVLRQIEKKFAISLEYADIFDFCTVAQQSALILEKFAEKGIRPAANTTETPAPSLVEDRVPAYDKLVQHIKGQHPELGVPPEKILLTGATGFLGVFVIRELLATTNARIICIIRATDDEAAQARLASTLRSYFPEVQLDETRIIGIKGDITREGLDLTTAGRQLLTNTDTVFHLAANVSHFGKVVHTEQINFEGTMHTIAFAKQAGVTRFNHFSTTAVATGGYIPQVPVADFYETDLDLGQLFGRRIYPASKFKAEQYLQLHKGEIQVNVFRIGNISGELYTGLFQQNISSNSLYQRLKTLAGIGCYCDEILEHAFAATPVDQVAAACVRISLHRNDDLSVFHILESAPIRLRQMVEQLAQHQIHLRRTDQESFLKKVQQVISSTDLAADNFILGVMKYGTTDPENTRFTVRNEATRAYLERIGAAISYDHEQYAGTVVRYCIEQGFIKAPVAGNA
ncbi:beta-ketoacyl synthase N-terminal-like domain-containing protein [Chitinophaga sp. Cy-1792]|uniref:beta-ketoacyl synthase N-terminal-like domain-containing protein n=1 Tax=Chitinophaga sp. Cy-1792 TaxID=2608339 RepID=UPI001420CD14|nr:beta-ketoacyl synthase N-terminal-like domain-containing protein [Chitinophaga sp. Cy-1792]NIG56804.1 NAD-dependent epimerase/dehydratase family protein [Chitinophaga sp. Cy-1792]